MIVVVAAMLFPEPTPMDDNAVVDEDDNDDEPTNVVAVDKADVEGWCSNVKATSDPGSAPAPIYISSIHTLHVSSVVIACKAPGLSSFIDTGTNICANISRIAIKIDKISSHQPFGVSNSPHPFNSVSKKADGIISGGGRDNWDGR
jgi:hypothetical protein